MLDKIIEIISGRPATRGPEQVARDLRLSYAEAGWSHRLRQALVIGSAADCDLRIDDARVDKRHAEIYPLGAQWWLRDLGTENGTFVQGEIIEAAPVKASSEIRLGVGGPVLRLECL